jgi:hypothetical protein
MPSRMTVALSASLLLTGSAIAASSGEKQPVTFTKDVAPILQEKCEACHRTNSMAPMALVNYEQTRPWAKSIKERVVTRNMPPWHLDKTVGIQHFQNDRSLTDDQIDTIARWVDQGAQRGDPKDMPAAKKWDDDSGWVLAKQFGEPDLIIKSEPYTMPSHGQDQWFKPYTDIPITEARWVRAVEMRPASPAGRRITHHALARLLQEEPADAQPNRPRSDDDPNAGAPGLLMEWAVGKSFDVYRPGSGKLLLPGSKIWWEMHYHAVGEEIRDHVELAVYLYPKGEVPKNRTYLTAFQAMPIGSRTLDIPPNSLAQSQNFIVLKAPARLENFQPHMHLRGKGMSMEAILPDGSSQMLSYVNNFNFNWMNNYIYADDVAPVLPKGTLIHITAWYDNTPQNRNNPDPDQWVGWGDRTVDEMGHAWVNVTYLSDEEYKDWASKHKPSPSRFRAAQ